MQYQSHFSILLVIISFNFASSQLPQYNVDMQNTTVSGVGAGGFMAVQMHVAFSRYINGAGIIGGGPFLCAQGNVQLSLTSCMNSPWLVDVQFLLTEMKYYSDKGRISPLDKLKNNRVLVISGTQDTLVVQGVAQKLELMYNRLEVDVQGDFSIPAENAWITDNYGVECSRLASPYINNCGVNVAEKIFKYIYGDDIQSGVPALLSNLQRFSQKSYKGLGYSMAELGYIYVPTACQQGAACQLHISFHGCRQTVEAIGEVFVQHTQLNELAEANNIIILYPQAQNSDIYPFNPLGCWDWWGYTDIPVIPSQILNYPTQQGKQMSAVWKMVQDLTGVKFTQESQLQLIE